MRAPNERKRTRSTYTHIYSHIHMHKHIRCYIAIEIAIVIAAMPLRYGKELLKWAGFGSCMFWLRLCTGTHKYTQHNIKHRMNIDSIAINVMMCQWFNACTTTFSMAIYRKVSKTHFIRHTNISIYIIYLLSTYTMMIFDFFFLFDLNKPWSYFCLRFIDKYIENHKKQQQQ